MIEIPSKIENHKFVLYDLEKKLKPLGYDIGSNWDYDHGSFDYKMSEEEGYQFFRVPFTAVDGELEQKGVTVQVGCPFVLSHKYQNHVDNVTEPYNALFNQFSEPVDQDAEVPQESIDFANRLNKELEDILLA
ncbi:YugN-like family protein [Alteribacillus persepolensis]|uniref:YugN-like family protein n=1 Tax=Alteribacillus persepolensis TaxID=568899 RepID=A0A1G8E1B7_9BACI|nr:YugN-like family protein [Alteribacillus persepolensis]SDH63658.1 YugN-like family protein [Alteribacillus persepolensis]